MLLVKKAYSLPPPRKTWTIQPGLGLPPPVNSASLNLAFSPGLEWLPLWLRVEENSTRSSMALNSCVLPHYRQLWFEVLLQTQLF